MKYEDWIKYEHINKEQNLIKLIESKDIQSISSDQTNRLSVSSYSNRNKQKVERVEKHRAETRHMP